MQVEILLSLMGYSDDKDVYEHLMRSNINTDAVVVNQTGFNRISKDCINDKNIKIYHLNEHGVGLSRNTALLRASADIALFADDDEVFTIDYETKIINAFNEIADADIILFNVKSLNTDRPAAVIEKISKVKWYKSLRYGAYQIAVRVNSIKKKRLYFSTLFGGGCEFGSGEDSLFLIDALNAGCNVYAYPYEIASVKQQNSTWFHGYDDKYFFDRGALYAAAFSCPKLVGIIQFYRKRKLFNSKADALKKWSLFCGGIKRFKTMI